MLHIFFSDTDSCLHASSNMLPAKYIFKVRNESIIAIWLLSSICNSHNSDTLFLNFYYENG